MWWHAKQNCNLWYKKPKTKKLAYFGILIWFEIIIILQDEI
jgi:hypothetical protein